MTTNGWKHDVKTSLLGLKITFLETAEDTFSVIVIEQSKIIINLISVSNSFSPTQLQDLANSWLAKDYKFVQLWEDVWIQKQTIVLDRIKSFCGLNTRIHARQTKFCRIAKPEAAVFLQENHLQGYANARFKYGLFYNDELYAVATFSSPRKMHFNGDYSSIELIRFALKKGYSIPGGLSKLLIGHSRLQPTNDIMTYIDRDWGAGLAFKKIGFTQTGLMEPQFFKLDSHLCRTKIQLEESCEGISVFNSGSIKMILKF